MGIQAKPGLVPNTWISPPFTAVQARPVLVPNTWVSPPFTAVQARPGLVPNTWVSPLPSQLYNSNRDMITITKWWQNGVLATNKWLVNSFEYFQCTFTLKIQTCLKSSKTGNRDIFVIRIIKLPFKQMVQILSRNLREEKKNHPTGLVPNTWVSSPPFTTVQAWPSMVPNTWVRDGKKVHNHVC